MRLDQTSNSSSDSAVHDLYRWLDESRHKEWGLRLAAPRGRGEVRDPERLHAADDLVQKALRAITSGNERDARAAVELALAVAEPGDEEILPASSAVVRLFVDTCREAAFGSTRGDHAWLDRVLSQLDALEIEVQDSASASFDDLDLSVLTGAELERLDMTLDRESGMRDPLEYTEPEERADILLGVLRLTAAAGLS